MNLEKTVMDDPPMVPAAKEGVSMDNDPISIFLTDARDKTLPIETLSYPEESPGPA